MTVRTTMSDLIARVRAFCGNPSDLTDDDLQGFLDDHAVLIDTLLDPRPPFYTQHVSPFENIESGAAIYYGFNTLLTESTDYTADYQRGIITTPQANYQGLKILGTAYDIHAAAADGWEQIASSQAAIFDWSDVEGSYKPSQARDYATGMAKTHRRKAWAMGRTVERGDTPALPGNDWRSELLRRSRAGYGTS